MSAIRKEISESRPVQAVSRSPHERSDMRVQDVESKSRISLRSSGLRLLPHDGRRFIALTPPPV
jgi:hypothetical protein